MSSLQSELSDIYKALICGKRLPEGLIKESFIRNGLIHLMVVSGAHLLFLERLWKKMNLPFFQTSGIIALLTLYALTANLHPPVLRALFSFLLLKVSDSYKLFWNSPLITHLSGILCLIYSPSWIFSPSLHLSWLASLAQHSSPSRLKKSLLTYIIILPICNRWQFLHPFTVFINWIVAPFIGSILFPLSLLTVLFHPLHSITDKLWEGTLKVLSLFQMFLPHSHLIKWSIPENGIWMYILLVFITLQVTSIYKKRLPVSNTYNKTL
ncbi:MAG: ComEC/Rec2 family competence protein [Bdellovibrionales bacterium]|nr:ComEC/Rec2 family competence protein [Bdellovibrionales bacterium]